jgi:hypothetical protein
MGERPHAILVHLVKVQLLRHFVGSCGFHTNPSVYLVR